MATPSPPPVVSKLAFKPGIESTDTTQASPHSNDTEKETLESHEVIELQAFSERKAWIEEKIKVSTCYSSFQALFSHTISQFLEQLPPIQVFVGIDAVRTSADVSKRWNKHHVIYMSNAAMLREMLEKGFCVRFVSSLPHAAPLELMEGFQDSLRCDASPTRTRNCTDVWNSKESC